MKITIINTGGTFNKIYDKKKGTLIVPKHNKAIKEILKSSLMDKNIEFEVKGIIYKDSLDMTDKDRRIILEEVKNSSQKIIIIHGTDTIDITAKFLDKYIKNKEIVLTGAMVPFSINKIEATSNFSLAISKLLLTNSKGIYISMNGLVIHYKKIIKDKNRGYFIKRY